MTKALPGRVEMEFRGGLSEAYTAHAGVSLLIDAGRMSGVMATAERVMPKKRSAKGLGQGQFVESFVLLSALGGDCIDDFDMLREDRGLEAILGYRLPAASTARQWLDQFHEEKLVENRPLQGSFIPEESGRLSGLSAVVKRTVEAYVEAKKPGAQVTLDVDAHIVESSKREAQRTYEGSRGYQPLLVQWAETGLVMADEFRDGNVPASKRIKELVDLAYAALPVREGGWEVAVRSDSAAYEYAALDHWNGEGWRFAVTADLSEGLVAEIGLVDEGKWQAMGEESSGSVREWAEVAYVPGRANEHKWTKPYRYLAIRKRSRQKNMLGLWAMVSYAAVVTNDWKTEGRDLLEWHRGKAGTIEHVHLVLKSELAAGTYPSGKFGANAAWLRLQVLTFNLLRLFQKTALDEQYHNARPKRLRFAIFTHIGAVLSQGKQRLTSLTTALWRTVFHPARLQLSLAWPG